MVKAIIVERAGIVVVTQMEFMYGSTFFKIDSAGRPIIPILTRTDGCFHRYKQGLTDRLTIQYGSPADLVFTGVSTLEKPNATNFPDATN